MPTKKRPVRREPTDVELARQVLRQRAHWRTRGVVQQVHLRVPVAPVWCQLQAMADMADLPFNSMASVVWQAGMEAIRTGLTPAERRQLDEHTGLCVAAYMATQEETGADHEVAEV